MTLDLTNAITVREVTRWALEELGPLKDRVNRSAQRDGYDTSDTDEYLPFPEPGCDDEMFDMPVDGDEDRERWGWREAIEREVQRGAVMRQIDGGIGSRSTIIERHGGRQYLWISTDIDTLARAWEMHTQLANGEWPGDPEAISDAVRNVAARSGDSQLSRATGWLRELVWAAWDDYEPDDHPDSWFSCESLRSLTHHQFDTRQWVPPFTPDEVQTLALGDDIACPACSSGRFRSVGSTIEAERDHGPLGDRADVQLTFEHLQCTNGSCGLGYSELSDYFIVAPVAAITGIRTEDEDGAMRTIPLAEALGEVVNGEDPGKPRVCVVSLGRWTVTVSVQEASPGAVRIQTTRGVGGPNRVLHDRLRTACLASAVSWPESCYVHVLIDGDTWSDDYEAAIVVGVVNAMAYAEPGGYPVRAKCERGEVSLDGFVKQRISSLVVSSGVLPRFVVGMPCPRCGSSSWSRRHDGDGTGRCSACTYEAPAGERPVDAEPF